MIPDRCPHCDGSGLRLVDADGRRFVSDCECRVERRSLRRLRDAGIPSRYDDCNLANYEASFASADPSLAEALFQARSFVRAYPASTAGRGLLLTGSIGVGKTHLAVGILRELITERGVQGRFVDYMDLLKQIQNTYNRNVTLTESEVLRPVFDAEVLVLDELGAAKPTDWVWDTVAHILNTRYNDCRTTILTTNRSNLPVGARPGELTLGDCITDRMRSRLHEMCVLVEMHGEDFRQGVKRARFG